MVLAPMIAALVTVSPAMAQTPDAATLARTVSDQAETIRRLEARLAALEDRLPAPPPPSATPQPAIVRLDPPKPAPQTRISWAGGGAPEFTSPDGTATFKPRGSLGIDMSTTKGSMFSARNITGSEARQLRLGVDGDVSSKISYQLEADFADSVVSLKSAYINYTTQALGRDVEVSVGARINDRTLEGSSASEALPFIERNAVVGLGPVRGIFGLGLSGKMFGDGWHVGVQVTGDDINNIGDARDVLTVSGRAHWNPVLTDTTVVHLAGWAYHETLAAVPVTLTRNNYVASHFNDLAQMTSGPIPMVDGSDAAGLELGVIRGRAWTFAEAGERRLASLAVPTVALNAQSLSMGWFLTGERSGYFSRGATMRKPRILNSLSKGGIGAWEIVGRVEHVDFTDAPLGGVSDMTTLGLNWYPESSTRLLVDWTHWRIDNRTGAFAGDDTGDSLYARVQLAF
jgi:phosphate-selective porin OprO/OprP